MVHWSKMQKIEQEAVPITARRDYALVKSYLERLGAPFFDTESRKPVNSTSVLKITDQVKNYHVDHELLGNEFYLKEEYKNQLSESVKGRAVASMVLNAIDAQVLYNESGSRKRWIEPTSGNTGKGLAEIAKLLGVRFTAVFSRLDISIEIKSNLARAGANSITIGSEYYLDDLEALARSQQKSIEYYWTMIAPMEADVSSVVREKIDNSRKGSNEGSHYDGQNPKIEEIDPRFLLDTLLPLAVQASDSPIVARIQDHEFEQLRKNMTNYVPELNDPNSIVAFLCNRGNSSMAVSNLLSQLGFSNVCSVKGGVEALLDENAKGTSSEFCPLPGSSASTSSIEFVRRLVNDYPEEYFTFMQYENIENVQAHMLTTGPELEKQIPDLDAVVCTFGTGGTATGLARYFTNRRAEVYVAFPKSPVAGIRTLRGAEGLSFYQPELYSKVIEVENSKADELLRYFAARGMNIGPSTAIALQAAIDSTATEEEKTLAVIAADGIENYLSEYKGILGSQ